MRTRISIRGLVRWLVRRLVGLSVRNAFVKIKKSLEYASLTVGSCCKDTGVISIHPYLRARRELEGRRGPLKGSAGLREPPRASLGLREPQRSSSFTFFLIRMKFFYQRLCLFASPPDHLSVDFRIEKPSC